jgi:hypothetical protein
MALEEIDKAFKDSRIQTKLLLKTLKVLKKDILLSYNSNNYFLDWS